MPGPTTESLATDFRDSSREFAQFREEFAGFRGRIETQLSLIRWVGTFMAAVLVSLVGSAVWLAWHASALNQRVGQLEQTAAKVVERLDTSDRTMMKVVERLEQLERTVTKINDRLDQALAAPRPNNANR